MAARGLAPLRLGVSAVLDHPRAVLSRILRVLPEGRGLQDEGAWRRRHHAIVSVLWLHVLGVAVYALMRGYSLGHTAVDSSLLVLFAAGASQPFGGRVLRSTLSALGLMSASALVVHLSGGLVEAHFHYFVMLALLSLYQDWVPLLISLAFVILEHGVLGAVSPQAVYYDNLDALVHPWKWAFIHGCFVLAAAAAQVYGWVTSEEDHRRASLEMSRREETFRALFESNPQPMWVYDVASLSFLAVNQAATALYGYSADEFLAMKVTDIRSREQVERLLLQLERSKAGSSTSEHLAKDGRLIHAEVHGQPMEFQGVDARLVVVADMTDRVRLESELSHRAFHDSLTDLANRELFYNRLEHALSRHPGDGNPVAVMTIDIDDFKGINDAHGHAAGDLLLVEVGRRLRNVLRRADTPARLGGDEFAVLLDATAAGEAEDVARRVLAMLQEPFVVDGAEIWPSASIGVAATVGGADAEELLRHADIAAYEAKAAGKNRVEVFAPGMQSGALHRATVAMDLRRALDRDELFLEYQPVVRLHDGRIVGVEALARWNHPERGLIGPQEFIPIAEETGLIVRLGAWVLREACSQMQRWRSALPDDGGIILAINVSPRQMRERDFVASVGEVIAATGVDPAQLLLEVTEGALVDNLSEARDRLGQLRARGVRVALDDFGTGYSSIGYLGGLPLDAVKIDRTFVAGLPHDAGRELALAIVRLVDTLGVPIVAEGIETAEELDYVTALGVELGQGYHFFPPIEASRVTALLAHPYVERRPAAQRAPRRRRSDRDLDRRLPTRRGTGLPFPSAT
ncbi:MAG TPA: EAL domain-containing protein [Candidatus Dormibacteraeota bacterium]|nr:EAL domain-containing protein [Candidatus Dormibacteraeota bacterium]